MELQITDLALGAGDTKSTADVLLMGVSDGLRIEICNIALSRIGNSRSINSMTEASKEAVQ